MTFTHAISTNNYGSAKFIVSTSAANGTHITLAGAMAAASSGDTIFLRDSVTENVTITPGVNIAAWVGGTLNTPSITGTLTMTGAGTSTISGLELITNSAAVIAVTGSAASILNVVNCYLNYTNNTGITFSSSNAAATINITKCTGDLGTTGISHVASTSAGTIHWNHCYFTNTGGSLTATTCSAGQLDFNYSFMSCPISSTSTGFAQSYASVFSATNTTAGTFNGTGGSNNHSYSAFSSGTASAVSVGVGATSVLQLCKISSTNTNNITGAGSVTIGACTFDGSSFLINTTTIGATVIGEKGTFTPALNFGGGTTGITYAARSGSYTRIGNVFTFTIDVELSNKGSSTGTAQITGFPYAPAATSICAISASSLTFSGMVNARYPGAGGGINIDSWASAGSRTSLSDTGFANGTFVQISGTYLI